MLLKVSKLRKAYGGIIAVKDCGFDVEKGKITALIGPNGAGKTTAFDLISGFVKADKGSVHFDGEELVGMKPHKIASLGISRTFQVIRLFPQMSAMENLLIAMKDVNEKLGHALLQTSGMKKLEEENEKKAYELLEFVGLESKVNELAGNLSYGQQKLLEIAKALAGDPQLIMLDEPAAGVNLTMLKKIGNLMQTLRKQGKTILFIEHNMDFVMGMADKVIVLDHGEEIAEGTPKQIQNNKKVEEAYLGKDIA